MAAGQRVELFGVPVDALTFDETVDRIRGWVHTGGEHQQVSLNAAKVAQLQKDPALGDLMRSCAMVSPDGVPIVWASQILGRPLPERVNGTDLMERLVEVAARDGHSIFLLGARPEVVANAASILRERHRDLRIAGYHHGYWNDDEEVISLIRAARPDYLFVGIPSPRKEFWVALHLSELKVPVVMGVGGSFDVIAGLRRRAPRWVCANGLEWAWRLAQEPRRMWKRYLYGNSRFVVLVLREWLSLRRPA
jgi:N-acetylglucosaminyldiphosphoundecaprenol N-acetyl-beta-D-mannosaminyltransferase